MSLFDWQSRYMRCRLFMIIAICEVLRSRSAQDLPFVGPTRPTVAPTGADPRGFQALSITNRDNRSFYGL